MKNQNADELLESIFYYMNQLFEKRDFTSTIEILTNLGRTLVQSFFLVLGSKITSVLDTGSSW